MKLLHVIAGMDPKMGGVCQAVQTMIAGLEEIGITNEVVSLDAPDQSFLLDQSIFIQALGPGKGPWCYSPKLVPWLIDNFPRFEGIIIHGLWLYPSYAVKKAIKLYKKRQGLAGKDNNQTPKIFVMPHGMLDPYFQQAAGRKLKAFRNYIYWKIIESSLINKADKILFTTEEECELAKGTFTPYRPRQKAVVGLGVEAPPDYSESMKEAFVVKCPEVGNQSYILFLSRIHEKKGVDLLVKAYANIISKVKGVPKLVIAGPGLETPYGEMIQKVVASSPLLSTTVFFTGMLTGEAKWGAFYGCEAFILPSYQENFGIAVVEAMACKKPVLISNKINIWREIKKSNSGIIVHPNTDEVEKLLKIWMDLTSDMKRTMGLQAYKLYQDCFAVEPAAKKLANALI